MTDHVDRDDHVDHDESTVIGSRRERSAAPASLPTQPAGTAHVPHATAGPEGTDSGEATEDTVLSSRPRPGAVAGESPVFTPEPPSNDDTVLSSRPRPGGASGATPDAGASDDTIVVPRRRSTARELDEPASDEDAVLRWSPTPHSEAAPTNAPLRTPREPVIDDQVRRRVASSPEPAILREPYRPRPIETTPVNRLQPTKHEVREPVDTVAAEVRRRGDSRRTLVAVLAVGVVIVLAGVAGIVALLTGLV